MHLIKLEIKIFSKLDFKLLLQLKCFMNTTNIDKNLYAILAQ